MTKTSVGFSVDTERDRDILAWLELQENKSNAIRAAIRATMLDQSVTLGDVLQELGEVKRMLRAGAVGGVDQVEIDDQVESDDPDVLAVRGILDTLGL